jgi:hypothetical protein
MYPKSKSDFLIGRVLYNIRELRTESGLRTLSCTTHRHLLQYFYRPYCTYLSVHTTYCTVGTVLLEKYIQFSSSYNSVKFSSTFRFFYIQSKNEATSALPLKWIPKIH